MDEFTFDTVCYSDLRVVETPYGPIPSVVHDIALAAHAVTTASMRELIVSGDVDVATEIHARSDRLNNLLMQFNDNDAVSLFIDQLLTDLSLVFKAIEYQRSADKRRAERIAKRTAGLKQTKHHTRH